MERGLKRSPSPRRSPMCMRQIAAASNRAGVPSGGRRRGSCMRTLVGTVGQSVLATDDGQQWGRVGPNMGFHSDAMVRTLVNRAERPEVIWAGTDQGILRSDDGGRKWTPLGGPMGGRQIWRISFHPTDDKVVFAGTGTPAPAEIFRSEDDGPTWKQLPVEVAKACAAVGVPPIPAVPIDPLW